jgi:hypothetical protein
MPPVAGSGPHCDIKAAADPASDTYLTQEHASHIADHLLLPFLHKTHDKPNRTSLLVLILDCDSNTYLQGTRYHPWRHDHVASLRLAQVA